MKTVTSRDGTRIAYDKTGSGPPLILVDGAFCSRTFGPMPRLAPILAPHFTVIAYDRRGRGDSTDTKPYAVGREIDDLEAVVGEVGGSAYVFGMSSGAVLALRAAAGGLGIKKLSLYEPPFSVNKNAGHQPPPDYREHVTRLIASGRTSAAVKYYLVDVIGMPAVFFYIMRVLPMFATLKEIAPTLPYDAAIMGGMDIPEGLLETINIPVQVIGGAKSPIQLRHAVNAVADALPDARLQILSGQTHNVDVKVLAPALREFFSV